MSQFQFGNFENRGGGSLFFKNVPISIFKGNFQHFNIYKKCLKCKNVPIWFNSFLIPIVSRRSLSPHKQQGWYVSKIVNIWIISGQTFFFHHGLVFFYSIQFNFIYSYVKKENVQEHCQIYIISGLGVFFHHGLGLFYFSFSFKFNSIQFYFDKFQKRICLRTLSILNYFRSKCLFPPWSCLFQFNSILFNHIS